MFGYDEEAALRNACSSAFPNSGLLSCFCHLKDKTLDYLKDTVGLCDRDSKSLMSSIFGTNGVTEIRNEVVFDIRLQNIQNEINQKCPEFLNYFKLLKNTSLLN